MHLLVMEPPQYQQGAIQRGEISLLISSSTMISLLGLTFLVLQLSLDLGWLWLQLELEFELGLNYG